MTAAVTVGRKCYVVPCVVCEGLHRKHRTDSRTCSNACRVRHRGSADTFLEGRLTVQEVSRS